MGFRWVLSDRGLMHLFPALGADGQCPQHTAAAFARPFTQHGCVAIPAAMIAMIHMSLQSELIGDWSVSTVAVGRGHRVPSRPISCTQSGRWSGKRSPWQKPWASRQKGLCISGLSSERENGAGGAPFFSLSLILLGAIDCTFSGGNIAPFLAEDCTFSAGTRSGNDSLGNWPLRNESSTISMT
jgi:hypothetical protein